MATKNGTKIEIEIVIETQTVKNMMQGGCPSYKTFEWFSFMI